MYSIRTNLQRFICLVMSAKRDNQEKRCSQTSSVLTICKTIHVQYTRTESDRLGYATVRLTGSPIARDLEKYTEVFTEGVKCWRIDSIGHKRTRPVSLCVGSTERKSDCERLRKIH